MRPYEKLRTPRIIFGSGRLERLTGVVEGYGAHKVLVVTDRGVVALGMADRVSKLAEAAGAAVDVFDGCLPDPPDTSVLEVAGVIREGSYDLVIGLGGGSSMDTAKVGSLLAGIDEEVTVDNIHDYSMTGPRMRASFNRPCRLVCIPTTSGTGAECTTTGVVTSTKLGLKFSCGNENVIPDVAIVDPELTVGMPKMPTVNCGMDILAHCMENAVGVGQCEYSNLVMLDCIRRAWEWLPVAADDPQDLEAREQLSWAAHNALCHGGGPNGHAVAHAVGALYHIVHGHACSMVLPAVFRHFGASEGAEEPIRAIAGIVGAEVSDDSQVTANNVAETVRDYYRALGLGTLREELARQGVEETREGFIAKAAPLTLDDFKSRLWDPPIHDDRAALERVLGMVWDD